MKKLLLSLLCAASAISISAAGYTIEFTTSTANQGNGTEIATSTSVASTVIADSKNYVTGNYTSPNRAYYSSSKGLKFGSSKGGGDVTFSVSDAGKIKAKSVTVSAAYYGTDTGATITITINSSITKTISSLKSDLDGSPITLAPPVEIQTIKLASGGSNAKKSRAYVGSITFEEAEDTGGKTPVTLSWTPDNNTLNYGEVFTAPEFSCSVEDALNAVTFTSDNTTLLDYVDGEWKFTPNVSGTANITASIPETDATYSATPATYTLTVAEKVKTPSQLSFSASEWSIMEGTTDLSGAPVLSNELGIEVIYSSSDETVAKFVDGALTLVGAGITTITASPADTETYTDNATYTLTVTPRPVLGAITVNGSEVADNVTVSGVVNTPVTFASANADLMVITIKNSNADIILNEEYVEGSTYTWTPTAADTYTVEITSTGCSDEKSITFDIDVTEKPAISLTADFIFAGDDANVVALASKVIEASSVQTDNATNDLNGVTLTAENGVTVSFAISGTENHPRYWHNDKTGNEVRAYNGNKITVTTPDNNYAINSIEFTKGGGGKWDMTTASAGQLTEQTWTYNNETVTSAVFTPSNRTDIGTISVTIAPRPKTPAISVNDEEITDFESSIDLKKGTVTVKITAADASHHLYYKHEGSEGVSVLANNDFTHIESNTHTFDISTNGTLTFYAQHPESKLESVKKYLTFTGDSTAIFEVEAEGNGEAEWFDLTGRRVAKPAKGGIFIIKQGSKTSKRAF